MWKPQSPSQEPRSPPPSDAPSLRQRNPGRRFGQVIRLKQEHVEEYKTLHAKIWPDVAMEIKGCGLQDYSIFYDDKLGLLFASFKYIGYDWTGDMERMATNPKVREWWKITDRMQESLVDGAVSSESEEPSWWKPMEEVFYLP